MTKVKVMRKMQRGKQHRVQKETLFVVEEDDVATEVCMHVVYELSTSTCLNYLCCIGYCKKKTKSCSTKKSALKAEASQINEELMEVHVGALILFLYTAGASARNSRP